MEQVVTALQQMPVAGTILRRRYERAFRTDRGHNCWSGVYPTFAAAAAAAPDRLPLGYDQPRAVDLYDGERFRHVTSKDYPVLYWLQRVATPASRLFDFGGHVGITYFAYRPFLEPAHMPDWTVCDVPAVAAAGAARADDLGVSDSLHFTTDFAEADRADVLLASGVLQYIETPFGEMVGGLARRPEHVVINKLPTARREYITLQNIGVAYCPYRIMARGALAGLLADAGYEQVDEWENPEERRNTLPFTDAGPVTWVGAAYQRR